MQGKRKQEKLLKLLYPVHVLLNRGKGIEEVRSRAALELLITATILGKIRNSPSELAKAVHDVLGAKHSKSTYAKNKVRELVKGNYVEITINSGEEYLKPTPKGAAIAGRYIALSRTIITLPTIAITALLASTIAPELTAPTLLTVLALYVAGLAALLWIPPPPGLSKTATKLARIAPITITTLYLAHYVNTILNKIIQNKKTPKKRKLS